MDKIQWNSELSLHILSRDEKLRTVYKIFSASEIERPQCECCASCWRKESKFARISKRRLSRFKRCHVSRLHFRRLHFGCRRNSPEWQTSRAVVERLQYIWNGKKSDKEVQSMPHFVKCFKMSTQLQACLCWLDCMFWFGSWATEWFKFTFSIIIIIGRQPLVGLRGVGWISSCLLPTRENARQLSVSQIRMHCSALQTIRMQQGGVVEEEERGRLWRLGLTCTLAARHNPLHSDLLHSTVPAVAPATKL